MLRLEKEVSDLTHQVKVSNKKVVHPLDSDPSNAIFTEDVDDEFVDASDFADEVVADNLPSILSR